MCVEGRLNIRTVMFAAIFVWVNLPSFHAFVGDAHAQGPTDKMVENLIARTFTAWPNHYTDLDKATNQKHKDDLYDENKDEAYWLLKTKKPDKTQKCQNKTKIQTSADWRLLFCTNAVKGELEHEVMVGIENESEYSQSFERAIENEFQAGMEFAIGPLGKDKFGTHWAHEFESAWKAAHEKETANKVVCEVFGGTWCMWQWHMTFKQCGEVIEWGTPITQCSRGFTPPAILGETPEVETMESGLPMSTLLFAAEGLRNSCSFVLVGLSVVIALYVALRRRHSGIIGATL